MAKKPQNDKAISVIDKPRRRANNLGSCSKGVKTEKRRLPEGRDVQERKTGMKKSAITTREQDYAQWFLDVIAAADLAETSPVRGCMVIKPNGYAIWENIQGNLDRMFKGRGVRNAYFPLFIPKSFLEKEAEHVEGFAKECAVVTHHRLSKGDDGKLVPTGKLEEPLVVRPTSETIVYSMFAKWIHTYRDLPLVINQWANVVRWEMRTRLFLRTTEFLWQEGHTAHATEAEAETMTLQMLDVYRDLAENFLAIPVIKGRKSESEKFAGAAYTTSIEAMMQDGKALQAGTSHMLGQNFARPFDVKFTDRSGTEHYAFQTSWGLSTRIIGALIMVHSDDKGLVLPPRIAPIQVVIIPILSGKPEEIAAKADEIAASLRAAGISTHVDKRDERPGPKFFDWEHRGVPLRIEIGPRDVENNSVVVVRRDSGEKVTIPIANVASGITSQLDDMQTALFRKAIAYRENMTYEANDYERLREIFSEGGTGFVSAYWCGDGRCEAKVKADTTATTRCIPFDQDNTSGRCVVCNKEATQKVIFAKSY